MRREIDPSAKHQRITARLGGVFAEVAAARGLSPYALARRARLTLHAVLCVLRGGNGCKADTVERFAVAFGVLPSELFALAEWRAGCRVRPPGLAVRLRLTGAVKV